MSTATITIYYCQFCDIVANYVKAKVGAYRHKKILNEGVRQLNAMSDADLKDIGLCRGDIPSIARGEYVRPESW